MNDQSKAVRVGVVMCTWNGARYLQEQLQSIANQTRLPDELLVCDDGSVDETPELVLQFAKSVSFHVSLIRNPVNLGVNANFSRALQLVDADLILICDQDDVWHSEKIAKLLWVAEQDRPCLAVHDARFMRQGEVDASQTLMEHVISVTGSNQDHVYGCCTAMNRSLRDLAMPFEGLGWGYDAWLHTLASYMGVREIFTEVLLCYRRHQTNASAYETYEQAGALRWQRWVRAYGKFKRLTSPDGHPLRTELNRKLTTARLLLDRMNASGKDHGVLDQRVRDVARLLQIRMRLIHMPRWRRWPLASWLWVRGGYAQFSGWKSWFVDMLCPQEA